MKKLLTLVAPLTLLASALPAQAATVNVSITGTANGIDGSCLFGCGSINGEAFTLRATIDLNTSNAITSVNPTEATIGGGPDFGTSLSPILRAFLQIGSRPSLPFGGSDGYGLFHSGGFGSNQSVFGEQGVQLLASGGLGELNIFLQGTNLFQGSPRFSLGSISLGNAVQRARLVDVEGTDVTFQIDRFSADALSAVPEPATWTMLIIGFGMIGFSMRLDKERIKKSA